MLKFLRRITDKVIMDFNHKDARVAKGLTVEQIARKLGAPDDLERVRLALRRLAARG